MRKVVYTHLILLMVMMTAAPCSLAKNLSRFKIKTVAIEGNKSFTKKRLEGLMLTRTSRFLAPSYYYPELFADDIDNLLIFYRQNGYLEAQFVDTVVKIDSISKSVDVYIRLDEGILTRIEGITIFGNECLADSILRPLIKLQQGDPLRRSAIEDAVVSLLSLYAENGYLDASVTPNVQVNSEAHLAIIDFIVQERTQYRVGRIIVDGAEKTKEHVIERELLFRPDEVVKYSRLLDSQRLLYLTGLFESVFIRPRSSSEEKPTNKDILIEIKEKPSSEFGVMVGYGSIEKIRGRVEFNTFNWAGTARKTGIAIEANFIKQGITTSFSDPWTFGSRWRTDINFYGELRQEPSYHAKMFGMRLTVGRRFAPHTTALLTYKFENTNLTNIQILDKIHDLDTRIRSLTLSFSHDTRDNLFDPQCGWYITWSNELAGSFLQGSNTFARSILVLKLFRPVRREFVAGSGFEIGWMDSFGAGEEIPLHERFFAGGPTSIRGFGYQLVGPLDENGKPLGGKFKIVWNAIELRRTLYKLLGGAVFLDVGNVWSDVKALKLTEIRVSPGVGIRLNSPIGIIRLDYSVNVDRHRNEPRGKIFLGMGQAF